MARCPRCPKEVGTHPNGKIRPHAVPIDQRRDPKKSEQCDGSGDLPRREAPSRRRLRGVRAAVRRSARDQAHSLGVGRQAAKRAGQAEWRNRRG